MGQLKGITVLATGDFTPPAWFAELREKLVPAEPGLFALKPDLARAADAAIPLSCRANSAASSLFLGNWTSEAWKQWAWSFWLLALGRMRRGQAPAMTANTAPSACCRKTTSTKPRLKRPALNDLYETFSHAMYNTRIIYAG